MLFNSWLFILAFAPLAIGGAAVLRKRVGRTSTIVYLGLASLVFYGASNPRHLPILLASILVNQLLAQRIAASGAQPARRWLLLGLALNIGGLFVFKYLAFAAQVLGGATGMPWAISPFELPVGISFFTFTQIAYLVDVHGRTSTPHAGPSYLLFVSYFPHLVAGPVLRHNETIDQFSSPRLAALRPTDVERGLVLFAFGLAKKVLIADPLAPFADATFRAADAGTLLSFWEAWAGLLSYTFQIYFDFSGYSDMALGLSLLLGIDIPVNFHSPYRATSMIDFWRRWHISLSRFLRDYVYIPLGGNRKGPARRHLNLVLTMLVGGLWHGAAWGFIAWGALHGLYLLVNHLWRERVSPRVRLPSALGAVLTFVAVALAWSFFRAHTIEGAFTLLAGACGLNGMALPQSLGQLSARLQHALPWVHWMPSGMFPNDLSETKLAALASLGVAAVLAWFAPASVALAQADATQTAPLGVRTLLWAGIVLAVSLSAMTRESPFLYFQF